MRVGSILQAAHCGSGSKGLLDVAYLTVRSLSVYAKSCKSFG